MYSGIIGGCVALGNLSGAFLGVGHEAMGRAASYIAVYILLFVATFTTGRWWTRVRLLLLFLLFLLLLLLLPILLLLLLFLFVIVLVVVFCLLLRLLLLLLLLIRSRSRRSCRLRVSLEFQYLTLLPVLPCPPTTVCFTHEMTKSQAVAAGVVLHDYKSSGSLCSYGGARKALSDMGTPFGNHDFRWVFISRLFVQMGIYTVQEYLLYYVKYAVQTPEGLSAEAAVSRPACVHVCMCMGDRRKHSGWQLHSKFCGTAFLLLLLLL